MAIYWPTQGFKGRTFKLYVFTRWDFNFCVRSSPLREGQGNSEGTKLHCIFMYLISSVPLMSWQPNKVYWCTITHTQTTTKWVYIDSNILTYSIATHATRRGEEGHYVKITVIIRTKWQWHQKMHKKSCIGLLIHAHIHTHPCILISSTS